MPDSLPVTRHDGVPSPVPTHRIRGYQQEMLDESLKRNIIIALDTGAGKTHIAVLRMIEAERKSSKVSWFLAPTVALAQQQKSVIAGHSHFSVAFISGANEPDQWKDTELWRRVLDEHRVVVSTHDVLLNALRHGYIHLGRDICLLVFDEAHHAADKHAYNLVMREFYDKLLPRTPGKEEKDVRPMILGLTASPTFGNNAEKAFRQLELNLDATICAPLWFRGELEGFVHRPEFKHVIYAEPASLTPSKSLRSLKEVVASLNIEEDPWVIDRRVTLQKHNPGPERNRIDQRLSRAIDKHDTFTHKGLRDFERAADEIFSDIGEWAADWYIQQVCKQAASTSDISPEFSFSLSDSERNYLLKHLSRVEVAPVPDAQDLMKVSDKVEKLIDVLLREKAFFEISDMEYRSLIFVTRRDAVLALTEVLARHPRTAHDFRVGSLLGESGSSRRRSFLDITRRLLRQPANETLADFRIGDLNVIVATAVAEEGLDISACCNVVRWDPPANMVSWAQSRGRARQQYSTFVLMLSDSFAFERTVRDWERLEEDMTKLYNTRQERREPVGGNHAVDDEDKKLQFSVEPTGAVLTGDSAIEHIFHFCSVLSSRLVNHVPLFEIDPPDYPLEWHAQCLPRPANVGPYGCTLILPRLVDAHFRTFSTPRIHPTKVSARRSVAFHAYRTLYENRLLNEHLLPLTSVLQPNLEHEVRLLLKEVERRESTALVSSQFDPWRVPGTVEADNRWWSTIIEVDGLPPLRMFTQVVLPSLRDDELPIIHTRERPQFKVHVKVGGMPIIADVDGDLLARARVFTRQLFWPMYSTRMKWDQTDFLHLFIPADESPTVWNERRDALASDPNLSAAGGQQLFAPFLWFEQRYGLTDDITDNISIVSRTREGSKPYKFVRLQNDPITIEEKADLVRRYVRGDDEESAASLDITYPLILARSLVKRNFLTPMPIESKGLDAASQKPVPLLLKDSTLIALISPHEAQFAQWAPSIIRHLQMASTVCSMRDALFSGTPMAGVSLDLLLTATTTPAAQERTHYQRLETLGDTVLKFVVTIQLLSAYPLWSEGYLARRKDHAVSNANLSKMAMHPNRRLYKWIIRDIFVPKRWKPRLASDPVALLFQETSLGEKPGMTEKQKRRASVVRNLSTKVLADVVEALIGAAYLHGSFALGVECMKVFDLGLSWRALPECVHSMYSRVNNLTYFPTQITVVEDILGYTFRRKAIAVEALMHASYQGDIETMSYERMEFLGDAVLDMLVTDYLYRAQGKDYGPGKIHVIKTAVVNAHFLAMLCLRAYTELSAAMPSWSQHDGITMMGDMRRVHLYKCLLHSNVTIMNEQQATFARWERPGGRDVIEAALEECRAFPWSALTSLQAPKFLSDMFESLLGAVYLDSLGDLDVTRDVLRRLGHWEVLERIVERNMDVQHPVSRLYQWASQHHEKVKCSPSKKDQDKISCSVLWDDYEVAKVEGTWRGRVSHEDVRFAVAEKATALLEDPVSLLRIWLEKRSCRIEYTTEEAEGTLICTAIADGTVISTVRSSDISATSEEETKRAAATEALKKLDMPVHWLAFLSAQYRFDVDYQIYEEDRMKVCHVYVNGIEAGKVEHNVKGPGPIKTEEEMMAGAAKEAIEGIERQVTSTESDNWEGAELGGSSDLGGLDVAVVSL